MRQALKATLRRTLIPLLAAQRVRRAFAKVMLDRAAIFMIHSVSESDNSKGLSTAMLTAMLEEVRARGLKVVSVQSLIEKYIAGEPQLPDSIAFTLDDGTKEQMEVTAPLLARYDCAATVFLITGFVDRAIWPWDYKIDYIFAKTRKASIEHSIPGFGGPLRKEMNRFCRDAVLDYCKTLTMSEINDIVTNLAVAAEVDLPDKIPEHCEPLSWQGARDLERQGIRFAPHGVSHTILSRLSAAEAEGEIYNSWKRVKEEMAFPCPVFAWPTGRSQDFGAREISYAKTAGLIGAVTASSDYAFLPEGEHSQDRRYRIGRFAMPYNVLDFLQYSTWIEYGKQRVLPRRRLGTRGAESCRT